MAIVGREVVGTEAVVNAHEKSVDMVADAGSVAGGDIAVGKAFGDGAMDV